MYLARVEKGTGKRLKCLRSDRGGEFISHEFNNFCIEKGIKRQVSAPGTPEQNGIAERRNRSIMDCARTLMIEKKVALKYWKEAISTAVHTLNRVQLKKDSFKTPYELWYGYKPNVSYIRIFGRKFYILKESREGKFDVKSDEGIFLGYSCKRKAYRCLNLTTHKVIESAHVKVDEFAEKAKEESNKEPEDYRKFVLVEPDIISDTSINQDNSTPESSVTEQTSIELMEPQSTK